MRRLMMGFALVGLIGLGAVLLVGGGSRVDRASALASKAGIERAYGRLPLRFEANAGQSDGRVRFLARTPGSTVFLTQTGATLALTSGSRGGARPSSSGAKARGHSKSAVVGLQVVGADPKARVSGVGRLQGVSNYLSGSDRRRWRKAVPGFGRVSYRSIYPGVDLDFYGRQRQLEYDFIVAPGADPDRIALKLSGGKRLHVDRSGDLVLETTAGPLRQRAPVLYQRVGGRRRAVSGGYVLKRGGRVGFRVGSYDRSKTLVIDPVLEYGTHLGGSSSTDAVTGIGTDPSCSSSCPAYVTGQTTSSDFPVKNAYQGTAGGGTGGSAGDAFVAKLNANGSALEYSTYLGGSASDSGDGIAVDGGGRAFVAGSTESGGGPAPATAFPTTPGAAQRNHGGSNDAFLAVLRPDGSALDYSTLLGGESFELDTQVAVRGSNAYLTGRTQSPSFPTTAGAFDRACGPATASCNDAFAAKIDPGASGSASLAYSTFLGGDASDEASGIAVDGSGAAYLTGVTSSPNFPVTSGALQTTPPSGDDAFVAKLKSDGSGLDYATYLSGSEGSEGSDIAVDPSCASSCGAYVVGGAFSTDFPTTPGAYQGGLEGNSNAFVSRVKPDGSGLDYSTYLGGGADFADAVAARAGKAYVTGTTTTGDDFPVKDPLARALGPPGDRDGYLAALDTDASGAASLLYSTLLSTNGSDATSDIAVDGAGSAYVGGRSQRSGDGPFPTTPRAAQPRFAGGASDGVVAKISPVGPLVPYVSGVSPLSGSGTGGTKVTISGRGFRGARAVKFGATPSASYTVDSDQQITAVSPPHAVGGAPVTVTTAAGTSPANPITVFAYGRGRFTATGAPPTPGLKPVVLKDGRVLLFNPPQLTGGAPASAALYDPKSEAWTPTAAPTRLPAYRRGINNLPYTATLLENGKVLVISADDTSRPVPDTAQLYDPAGGGSWTNTAGPPGPAPGVARAQASATRLDGPACRSASPPSYCGKVLVAGGLNPRRSSDNFASAEIYDPKEDKFTPTTASMKETRRQHGAVLLDDVACHSPSPPSYCGKVLVAGGFDVFGVPKASGELYDPASDSWSDAAPLKLHRARHTLVQLPDGRVLEPGGHDIAGNRVEDTEFYDPAKNTWEVTNLFPGVYPTIPTLLPDGKVFVIGATGGTTPNSGAPTYLFDPALRQDKGDWTFAGLKPVYANTVGAVLLSSDPLGLGADPRTFKGDPAACGPNCGKVLVVGANLRPGSRPPEVLASAQLFTPEPDPRPGPGPRPGARPPSYASPATSCPPGSSGGVACQPLPGGGRRITGTAGNDTLNGSAGNDVINCGAGNDVVNAGGGDDVINCGAGDDRVSGNGGNDRINGESGNDRLSGNEGNDRVGGGSGNDRANGNEGNDRVNGRLGNDRVGGQSGRDRLGGDSGRDRVGGGSGNDRVGGQAGNDRVNGDSGNDRVSGGSGRDRLSGASGRDSISARDRTRDSVTCGRGRDRVTADRRRGRDRVSGDCERVRRR